jgi:hypothetical protein
LTARTLADDEPVEQHADRGQVLLDGRLGGCRLQHLYIGGDVNRFDVGKLADLVLLDPGEEMTRGTVIGHAGVLVTDRRVEKLDKAARGMVAGIGDHRRHDDLVGDRCDGPRGGFGDEFVHGA